MPDPVPAIAQVEDILADTLSAHAPLTGWTIETDRSLDEAMGKDEDKTIFVYAIAYKTTCAYESGRTEHEATFEFECASRTPAIGTISRANHAIIAHIIGAIAPDRTLGGRIQWIEEVDVAPAEARGKDVNSVSLQMSAIFYTPHDDWFTLVV